MEKKITKRERFDQLLTIDAVVAIPGMKDWILHEQELLSKKNAKSGGMTEKQKLNAEIQQEIVERMEKGKGYTITDIQKDVVPERDLSNQKVTHLVSPLADSGILRRETIKRKAYFFKDEEENSEE